MGDDAWNKDYMAHMRPHLLSQQNLVMKMFPNYTFTSPTKVCVQMTVVADGREELGGRVCTKK